MSSELKFKINYKDYPEYMFAIVAAYLDPDEGIDLRRVSGSVIFRHEDSRGYTYKNGVLHSYNDEPAIINEQCKVWYKNGERHRDGDQPAFINGQSKAWFKNGEFHRDGNQPAIIDGHYQEWYKDGKRYNRRLQNL